MHLNKKKTLASLVGLVLAGAAAMASAQSEGTQGGVTLQYGVVTTTSATRSTMKRLRSGRTSSAAIGGGWI